MSHHTFSNSISLLEVTTDIEEIHKAVFLSFFVFVCCGWLVFTRICRRNTIYLIHREASIVYRKVRNEILLRSMMSIIWKFAFEYLKEWRIETYNVHVACKRKYPVSISPVSQVEVKCFNICLTVNPAEIRLKHQLFCVCTWGRRAVGVVALASAWFSFAKSWYT